MITKKFVPLFDITAWELAQIMSLILFPTGFALPMAKSVRFNKPDFENMDECIKRHFVDP